MSLSELRACRAERPMKGAGEQEHLREDAGMTREAATGEAPAEAPAEHLRKDAGEREDEDRGLIDKAREKLKDG
jgi:hypothetical protein